MRGLRSIAIALIIGLTCLAGSSSPGGLGAHRAVGGGALAGPVLVDVDGVRGHRWAANDGTLGHRWMAWEGAVGRHLD